MSNEKHEPKIEQVKQSEIQPGPVGFESLTEDQHEATRAIYQCLGPYLRTSLEQFEMNFLRDAESGRKIQVWRRIALAHQTFIQRQSGTTNEEAERAFKAFFLMSIGASKPSDISLTSWESLETIFEGR